MQIAAGSILEAIAVIVGMPSVTECVGVVTVGAAIAGAAIAGAALAAIAAIAR